MATVVIDSVDRAPGNVGAETLMLRNLAVTSVVDISGWVLRTDLANSTSHPLPANTKLAESGTIQVVSGPNPAGPNLPDPPGIHYLNQPATIWDQPGTIAVLADAGGTEQSRYGSCPLPPNTAPYRIVVPAYFDVGALDQWQLLSDASTRVGLVVLADPHWPDLAVQDAAFADQASQRLSSVAGTILGVVDTRDGTTLLTGPQLDAKIEAWYLHFGPQIDGIFLRELIQADLPGDTTEGLSLLNAFKQRRPEAKTMIKANQCTDPAVMATADWVVLWEGDAASYLGTFQARDALAPVAVPGWWHDPMYRDKIVHLVHTCPEPSRQTVIGYVNEHNAGNFYVTEYDTLYDRLPPLNPYWDREVIEANSYLDFGLDPRRTLEAAHRWGIAQKTPSPEYLHGWPTGEQVWNAQGHVHGTFLLKPDPTVSTEVVKLSDLRAERSDELAYDVAATWAAAHQWAQLHQFKTALPSFWMSKLGGEPAMRLYRIALTAPWLQVAMIPRAATYQQPSYNEVLSLLRNLGRVPPAGYWSAIPTFAQSGPTIDIPDSFTVLVFTPNNDPISPSPIDFKDALTVDYIHTL